VIDEAALELAIKHVLECYLAEGLKPLAKQTADKWSCQCQASGAANRDEYLTHVSMMLGTVVRRFILREEIK
jgi:hypothetical protein